MLEKNGRSVAVVGPHRGARRASKRYTNLEPKSVEMAARPGGEGADRVASKAPAAADGADERDDAQAEQDEVGGHNFSAKI